MQALRQERQNGSRRGGLRTRFLLSFLAPVLLVGAGNVLLIEFLIAGQVQLGGLPVAGVRIMYSGLLLVSLLLSTGLGLYVGDRVTQPIVRLLRAMDTGQIRILGGGAATAADWEMGVLVRKVQILLQQNLSGAQAMEQLDALREEIAAVLDAATAGDPDVRSWPRERATHPLTRQLIEFFRAREEGADEARGGLMKLQGLLEQDWRDETQCVEEIVKRTERCFLEQTQVAMELEQLERLLGAPERESLAGEEAGGIVKDLRLGFDRWQREIGVALNPVVADAADPPGVEVPGDLARRLEAWSAWVRESFDLLEGFASQSAGNGGSTVHRAAARLGKVTSVASEASQEMGSLSREAAQLQRTWVRLGERMRSLMVRIAEVHNGIARVHDETVGVPDSQDGGAERDSES
jgi:hypothetical protein